MSFCCFCCWFVVLIHNATISMNKTIQHSFYLPLLEFFALLSFVVVMMMIMMMVMPISAPGVSISSTAADCVVLSVITSICFFFIFGTRFGSGSVVVAGSDTCLSHLPMCLGVRETRPFPLCASSLSLSSSLKILFPYLWLFFSLLWWSDLWGGAPAGNDLGPRAKSLLAWQRAGPSFEWGCWLIHCLENTPTPTTTSPTITFTSSLSLSLYLVLPQSQKKN